MQTTHPYMALDFQERHQNHPRSKVISIKYAEVTEYSRGKNES